MKSIYSIIAFFLISLCVSGATVNEAPAAPANPKATPEAKQLFSRLMNLQERGTMYGHQDDLMCGFTWWYQPGRSDTKDAVGDYPAVAGFELGEIERGGERSLDSVSFAQITEQVKLFHKKNGIITVSWHATNPITSNYPGQKAPNGAGSAWDVKPISADSLNAVKSILPGGKNHEQFNRWLTIIADYFKTWKDDNGRLIPFIFRPFHEHSGSFFWWGNTRCTDKEYADLWRYTVNFLRKKGLNNILFAYNTDKVYSLEQYLKGYPGDEYVDVISIDWYGSGPEFDEAIDKALSFTGQYAKEKNKLHALSECGPLSSGLMQTLKNHDVSFLLTWRNRPLRNLAELEKLPDFNEKVEQIITERYSYLPNKKIMKEMFDDPHFLFLENIQEKTGQDIQPRVTITKAQLLDKIKGGWAGQTIGCTYGGPSEFKFNGTMIQDYVPIEWTDGIIKWNYENNAGLYDDVYMDLTFVDVFDRLGLDAPVDSFAMAFANAGYSLWHANQAARYNILQGIMPPASGHWLNNPHADDIDYQIESDYSGLMSPGMPNSASAISDKIGHIMNYGNGWYGGVFISAMYTLSFLSDNIEYIVTEALKIIPEQSAFHQCISDVINWHKEFPDDWKRTWFECQKKWSSDIGCPDGVFVPFNIDAVINNAYVVIGLLYGNGDFSKTIDIATRCGQDADCNPASAGGVLGAIIGYDKIPEYWMKNLREVEDMNFAYTNISLNKTYKMSFNQALQMIERNGGKVDGDNVTILCQQPKPVRYEKAFEGLYPVKIISINKNIDQSPEFEFEGTGFVAKGGIRCDDNTYTANVEVYLDGKLIETAKLPADFRARRQEVTWKYQIPKGNHKVSFKWLNPKADATINVSDVIIYSDTPTTSV